MLLSRKNSPAEYNEPILSLLQMIGGVTTYLVIVIQFHLANPSGIF
jgi:hypothetical protein